MKKLLAIAAVVGVLFAIKRSKDAKADADLWREATAPSTTPGANSSNGSTPAATTRHGSASQN
ncbi:DLW-39 family protein [Thermocrispum municipale]|jgi:hypothetical protein|uniref:DLW-39 family protein n=1 Tax=Thermocrispum municipale TaxID=37926 RepID=UPI00041E1D29|nr:DLW-39 family protein [Thermocrispum municipale]